jgi:hypothetical protein
MAVRGKFTAEGVDEILASRKKHDARRRKVLVCSADLGSTPQHESRVEYAQFLLFPLQNVLCAKPQESTFERDNRSATRGGTFLP